MRACAVVLGGYVNGYSIIQELHECGVKDIVLVQYGKELGGYSNKIIKAYSVRNIASELKSVLCQIAESYEYLVLFPSDDIQVKVLKDIEEDIQGFSYLPFNSDNIILCSDKYYQYDWCEKLGVPYPKTIQMRGSDDFKKMKDLRYPLLLKPNTREDMTTEVFRSMRIENDNDLNDKQKIIIDYLQKSVTFLCSVIPGDSNGTIFAYTAFRSKQGNILNGWVGKKLSQYPDDYGVFSSASNEGPEIIAEQGRTLLNGMDIHGIAEPEFKYDPRDGKYKLTEINLRSMMWHRTGNRSGVYLQYTQWLSALNLSTKTYEQEKNKKIHFCYLKYELVNLVRRRAYAKHFINNIFKSDKTYLANWDWKDVKPFFADILLSFNYFRR